MPVDSQTSDRVALGYVTRTKGIRGDVKVEVLTHRLSRFDEIVDVVLQKPGYQDRALRIERWRREDPGIRLKFVGIETPEEANEIAVKGYITIARDEMADLPDNEYYISDLLGCRVQDELGNILGTIEEVMTMPSTDVYVVKNEGQELLLPAVGDFIVEVSIARRQLVVRGVDELVEAS